MSTEVFGHWDSRVVGNCKENSVSSYGCDFIVDWWSWKSCATMTEPKQVPFPWITVRRDFGVPMLDVQHRRGKRY
jgi:hypothetical protein